MRNVKADFKNYSLSPEKQNDRTYLRPQITFKGEKLDSHLPTLVVLKR